MTSDAGIASGPLPAAARSHRIAWAGGLLLILLVAARVGPELAAMPEAAGQQGAAEIARVQLFELRLPRLFAALLAGAALGLSGTLFQALTRNPLAAPDILGITAGSQLGLLGVFMLPVLGGVATPPFLFLCGLGAAALVAFAAGGHRSTPLRLVLAGSACALFFSAITTLLLALYEQNITGVALWSGGSLYQPGGEGLITAALWLVLPLCGLLLLVRPMDIYALGDDQARSLGLPLGRARLLAVGCAVGCAAVAVGIAGPVGFVGLLAPNLLRAAGVHRMRLLLPLAGLWGALLLMAADSLVILIDWNGKLLVGVVVALAGTPLLLALIRLSRHLHTFAPEESNSGPARTPNLGHSLVVLAVMMASVFAVGLSVGLVTVHPGRWLPALACEDPLARILLDLRAPRLLVAAIGGSMLASSGVLLQSVVRNPLAGPELLGITQGAGLATLTALIAWPAISQAGMFGMALAGGVCVLGLTLAINRRHGLAPLPVALTGIALGSLCIAVSQWLIVQFGIQPAQSLVWLAGGTYGRSWSDVQLLLGWLLLCLPLLMMLARPLDLLALGEETASAVGVKVAGLRMMALALAALMASVVVAVIGPVSFVGLIMPHVARLLGFTAHAGRLPVAMLLGALMLMVADLLARSLLAPREIPAGVLTALFGAPYFLLLLAWRDVSHRSRLGRGAVQ
jgi:ABC-type Fe3+-siderophore transport system permease subunit